MVSPMKTSGQAKDTGGLEQCWGVAALGRQDSFRSDQEMLLSFEAQRG